MNLINGIIFDKNELKQNSFVKLTYTGFLSKNPTSKLFAHIGFGSNWDNIVDLEMKKSGIGYELIIQLPSNFDSINIAFVNNKNEWDNNFGNDFSFKLVPINSSKLVPVTEVSINCLALQKNNNNFRKFKLFFMKVSKYFSRIFFNNSAFTESFNK